VAREPMTGVLPVTAADERPRPVADCGALERVPALAHRQDPCRVDIQLGDARRGIERSEPRAYGARPGVAGAAAFFS
jgi:hypothetical protein